MSSLISLLLKFVYSSNLRNFLSIAAFTISIISLSITLKNEFKKKPRVKIQFSNAIFFDKLKNLETYIGNSQGLVRIKIISDSSSPITIHNLIIKNNDIKLFWSHPLEDKIPVESSDGSGDKIYFQTQTKFQLPIRIEPYGVHASWIFLPAMETSELSPIPLIFCIEANNKTFYANCLLKHSSNECFDTSKFHIKVQHCTNNSNYRAHKLRT